METFVVRIWTEGEELAGVAAAAPAEAEVVMPEGSGARSLLGIVRHVRTGSEWRFADAAELAAILGGSPPGPASTRS